MNVMIVDDEVVQVETIGRGLRSRGYKVCFALNGGDALGKLNDESRKIDLVITDYAMPEMNGLTLLKKIRERNGAIPVIMMTAYADKELVIDALRNRCASFIEKPFTLDQLIREIDRARVLVLKNTYTHELSSILPSHLHQINNPLMSIVGSAELAMHKLSEPDTVEKCIHRIIGSVNKISEINESLMERNPEAVVPQVGVDLNQLLDDALLMFQDLLTLKEIPVEVNLAENVQIQGDRFDLEQAFKNVILNAIDAMDGCDSKRLSIRTQMVSSQGNIQIQIKDTGCGIAEQLLDKLFIPYFSNKRHGNGLGLTVVKNIVEKHKGSISVHSREKEGATFIITLPVASASLERPVAVSPIPYSGHTISPG